MGIKLNSCTTQSPRLPQESLTPVQLQPVNAFTFSQDLGDLGVAGAEGAVDLEAIGIIQE